MEQGKKKNYVEYLVISCSQHKTDHRLVTVSKQNQTN
jgi:hypothetical protein